MSNPTGKGGFGERKQQINRKGRPRNFDALRELAKQIAVDVAKDNKGQEIAIPGIDDRITVVQAILLQMSRDPRRQKEFLEIAFGKVPDELNIKGKLSWRKFMETDDTDPGASGE
jgi:hypothetical protein